MAVWRLIIWNEHRNSQTVPSALEVQSLPGVQEGPEGLGNQDRQRYQEHPMRRHRWACANRFTNNSNPHTICCVALGGSNYCNVWNRSDAQMNYEEQLIHSGSQIHWVLCSLHARLRTPDPLAPGRPSVPGLPCRLRESTQSEWLDPNPKAIFLFNLSLHSKAPAET